MHARCHGCNRLSFYTILHVVQYRNGSIFLYCAAVCFCLLLLLHKTMFVGGFSLEHVSTIHRIYVVWVMGSSWDMGCGKSEKLAMNTRVK